MPPQPSPLSLSSRTTRASVHASGNRHIWEQPLSRRPVRVLSSTASTSASTTIQDSADEIVVRDQDGRYQFEIPGIPVGQNHSTPKEREEARLAEAIKYHLKNRNRHPSDPAELVAAVQQSLRETAASLKEDNWMYEAEEDG